MSDSSQVIEVLKGAHDLVRDDWGTANLNTKSHGAMCASVAISTAAYTDSLSDLSIKAHEALLRGAGQPIPADEASVLEAVYAFNDAQESRRTVLLAIEMAVKLLENPLPIMPAFERLVSDVASGSIELAAA